MLKINFDEDDYSVDEYDITGLSGISLSCSEAQAPFLIQLIPESIDVAKAEYNLTGFLSLTGISEEQKAQSGECCSLCTLWHHTYTRYNSIAILN